MKVCPYCAEDIQDAAIVCMHCHRELTAVKPKTSRAAWMALGLVRPATLMRWRRWM